MDVSFLTHAEFKAKPRELKIVVQDTPFGQETSLWCEDALCALGYGEHSHVLKDLKSQFAENVKYIVSEPKGGTAQKILLVGTAFQHRVWKSLLALTPGQTCTYQNIAKAISHPTAVRAVGTAIGRNPISYHVPCHRVLRKDGNMGGYRWGIDIKRKMLQQEKVL